MWWGKVRVQGSTLVFVGARRAGQPARKNRAEQQGRGKSGGLHRAGVAMDGGRSSWEEGVHRAGGGFGEGEVWEESRASVDVGRAKDRARCGASQLASETVSSIIITPPESCGLARCSWAFPSSRDSPVFCGPKTTHSPRQTNCGGCTSPSLVRVVGWNGRCEWGVGVRRETTPPPPPPFFPGTSFKNALFRLVAPTIPISVRKSWRDRSPPLTHRASRIKQAEFGFGSAKTQAYRMSPRIGCGAEGDVKNKNPWLRAGTRVPCIIQLFPYGGHR